MPKNDIDEFLRKLRNVMAEHGIARISFDCHPCSDLHGVTGAHLSVEHLDRTKRRICDGYDLYLGDLPETKAK